jgi:tRNA-binding protein
LIEINYEDFRKVDIRVGTVLSVKNNEKARQPALVLEVDFGGNIGVKSSSAKITHYYNSDNLVGKQIIAVCNFPTKNIAGVESEVLVLGAMEEDGKVVLIHPSKIVANGLEII